MNRELALLVLVHTVVTEIKDEEMSYVKYIGSPVYIRKLKGRDKKLFSYIPTKTCCGQSLEAPHGGISSKYPQHMFSLRRELFTCT